MASWARDEVKFWVSSPVSFLPYNVRVGVISPRRVPRNIRATSVVPVAANRPLRASCMYLPGMSNGSSNRVSAKSHAPEYKLKNELCAASSTARGSLGSTRIVARAIARPRLTPRPPPSSLP